MKNPFKKQKIVPSEIEIKKNCLICSGLFDPSDCLEWKKVWICHKCFDSQNLRLENNCLRLSNTELLIQAVYSGGLCPIPASVIERLEKSRDFSPLVKRAKYYAVDRMLAYLSISIAYKQRMTKWVYGGNYDIYDDFESGYTVQLSLEYSDAKLRKLIVGVLRDHGFGCLVSEYGALGHKNENSPTHETAEKIMDSIRVAINESDLEFDEPEWSRPD